MSVIFDNVKGYSILTLVQKILLMSVSYTSKHITCTNITLRVSVYYYSIYLSDNKAIVRYRTNVVKVSLSVSSYYYGN